MKDEDNSNNIDKGIRNNKEVPKKGGKSEYKHSREANIVRNNKLLHQVKEKYVMEPFQKGEKKKKGDKQERKGKKKEKVHREPTRSSARTQGTG